MSCGFQQAGFDIVCGVDHVSAFKDTYEKNHDSQYILGDLSKMTGQDILNKMGLSKGDVDVVIGGPPCQGFSLAGPKVPSDPRNLLVTAFVKRVYEIGPSWFTMENVHGLELMEKGKITDYLLKQFRKIGYNNTKFDILNSVHYGVPQRRKRTIFLGSHDGSDLSFPKKKFFDIAKTQQNLARYSNDNEESSSNRLPARTIMDAFSDLPPLLPGEEKDKYDSPPKTEYQKIMRQGDPPLKNHKAPNHGERVINRIRQAKQGEQIPYPTWSDKKRLAEDRSAPTLLAGPRPTYHFAHPTQDRGLSVRERARIQSFPDRFIFYGPVAKQRQQTGNAVPPLMSQAVAELIKSKL